MRHDALRQLAPSVQGVSAIETVIQNPLPSEVEDGVQDS
jgi:hypothetical protein